MADPEDYKRQAYWFPDATRVKAEQLLGPAPAASFLLRPSSQAGAVAISIKQASGIEHALIEQRDGAFHILLSNEAKQAASIVALINSLIPHYLRPNPLFDPVVANALPAAAAAALQQQSSVNALPPTPTSAAVYAVLPSPPTPVTPATPADASDDDAPFDPKVQKYHRGASRLKSLRAPTVGPAPLPSAAASVASAAAAATAAAVAATASAASPAAAAAAVPVDERPPLPLRSSSLGFLRSVMPRPRVDLTPPAPAPAPATAAAQTAPPEVPPFSSIPSEMAFGEPGETFDDVRDVRASPSSARRPHAGSGGSLSASLENESSTSSQAQVESPRKLSGGSDQSSGSPPASPRLLASLAASSAASASLGDDRDFSSLPALLAYFITLERAYADDLQETIHKVKQQLEGCLEHDLSVTTGHQILELLRALPELHELARRCVTQLPPMTPIGGAARVLASLAEAMNVAHCRYAALFATTSAPLAALAANERRAPRAQPPSATWQHLVAQASTVTKSGARVPLAAQLQRPLKAVDRHAAMARALRRYATRSGVVDESTLLALETAAAATAAAAADVAAAWASSLGRARLAAVFDKLSRSKSGRRSGLLQHDRTLRIEGLDMYIGKTRHCLWLFSDFLLLVRPTRDNKSYDLVWEQELASAGCEPISAEASKKLGPHAFVLRCGKSKKFDMETASDVEAQRWIQAINKS